MLSRFQSLFLKNKAKSFETKKTARAASRIFLAIASCAFVAAFVFSVSFRAFAIKHPGLIGVLIAVAGEVYFDWKEATGNTAELRKFFMCLLVVGMIPAFGTGVTSNWPPLMKQGDWLIFVPEKF